MQSQNPSGDKILSNQPRYARFKEDHQMDIFSISEASNLVSKIASCSQCGERDTLELKGSNRVGLAVTITAKCSNCGLTESCSNSQWHEYEDRKDQRVHSINVAFVTGLRRVGVGEAGAGHVCAFLNLPKPPSNYGKYQNIIGKAFRKKADESMANAVKLCVARRASRDIGASGDGSWNKRGRTSLISMESLADYETNLILAIFIGSKYCPIHKRGEPCPDPSKCLANYVGSSGGMEAAGMIEIVKSLYYQHGVRLVEYLGDGDSSAFLRLSEAIAKLFPDWPKLVKLECINHVGKRAGTQIRVVVQSYKGKTIPELGGRTGLGGKDRLTGNVIDRLQRTYQFTIRDSQGDPEQMGKRVMAIYNHVTSTDEKPNHGGCDIRYCKYTGELDHYKHADHFHLPPPIMGPIKKTFEALSEPKLMQACAHGKTQNTNECFNSTVWHILPKSQFANKQLVELGTFLAVLLYNEGYSYVLEVLEEFGHPIGSSAAKRFMAEDEKRVKKKMRKDEERSAGRGANRAREDCHDDDYGAGEH